MKDIMQKLAELEATAPKVTKKKMLNEDSTTPPINVSNKPASLKDLFHALSESIPSGQKPLPVLDPQNKQAGMGFVTSNNPAVQNMLKALDPKDVQIVQAPGQPGQPQVGQQQQQQTGQPAPAGATGQQQMGQQRMQEESFSGGSKEELAKEIFKIDDRINQIYNQGAGNSPAPLERKLEGLQAQWNQQFSGEDPMKLGKALWQQYHADQKAAKAAAAAPSQPQKKSFMGRMADKAKQVVGMKEEQLDELSPETLASYLSKTGKEAPGLKDKYVKSWGKDQAVHKDAENKMFNREFGQKAAFSKMTGQSMGLDSDRIPMYAKVPAKSVAEGAKVDRMVKHIEKSEKKLGKSKDKAEDIAWATANKRGMLDNKNKKKVKEGDLPSSRGVDTMGAGLGAGRSQTTLEAKEPQVEVIDNAFNRENYKDLIGKKYPKSKAPSYARVKEVTEGKKGVNPFPKKDEKASIKAPAKGKKPDFLDLDKDGNKKEPMKKAAADKKKQKVKESMNHRISAARLEGKSHGLRGHAHSGKRYEDLDEVRAYHEGYKEGLDECYGQGVYETAPAMPAATVGGMASQATPAMEDEMGEGNAFTAALAKTPKGGKFSVGGKTFTDRTGYDAKVNEYAFESLDQQLNALLNEGAEVNEGLSVSISKGQENSPDSVTITAQDAEAEHLLAFVKNAGLGLFGDDNADTHSSAMSVQPSHGAPDEVGAGGIDIGVVDGHDGMMGLMQKLSGIQSGGAEDYADEEGEEQLYGNHEEAGKKDCGCDGDCECSDYDQPSNEATCNECGGMMEAGHSCGSKEVVDEVESEDQMEFEVAEDNAPDSGEAETSADENAEAKEDAALAGADSGDEEEMNESDDEEEETVSESFANLFRKLAFIAEESTEKEDDKAEKAGKKVAKDIEHDEGHKGKDDDKAEKAGKKVTKDIEYDDKKDKKEKVDEWANNAGPGKTVSDTTFEQDIDFMTKVISGGLNKQKSTGQTTIPVIAGQEDRIHDESTNTPANFAKLAGIK